MKLSYRDKVIFVVAIVLVIIIVGIFVVIKPKFEEMNRAKLALENKQKEQTEVQSKMDTLPDIVKQIKAVAQEVGEIQDVFLIQQDPYLNEQFVREILGNNVDTLSMNTEYTSADRIESYIVPPKNVVSYDLLINGDLYNELPQKVYDNYNGAEDPIPDSIVIGITKISVDYRDKTDYSGIYKFIDAVRDNGKTVIVTDFTRGEDAESSAIGIESSIGLEVYSVYPLNVDKVMEESEEFVFDPNLVVETTDETAE